MDHRTHSVTDADLDREIEAALAVDPSPWLIARVRARVASQPIRRTIPWRWAIGSMCAAATAIAIVTGARDEEIARLKPSPTAMPSPTVVVSPSEVVSPTVPKTAPSMRSAVSESRSLVDDPSIPEVIIDPEDVKAFQQLIVSTSERRFEASFDATPPETAWVTTELSVAPIVIEPLESRVAIN
jgi:hypothetical protein